uniref:Uncharacterized protein n=1 Tax=Pelodiscus sinensis TaxID=13735 RepID=K7FKW3_PELSI
CAAGQAWQGLREARPQRLGRPLSIVFPPPPSRPPLPESSCAASKCPGGTLVPHSVRVPAHPALAPRSGLSLVPPPTLSPASKFP